MKSEMWVRAQLSSVAFRIKGFHSRQALSTVKHFPCSSKNPR